MRRVTWLTLVMCAQPLVAVAQDVSMGEYLSTLKRQHPFVAQEALSQYIERAQQKRFLGEQDWVLTAKSTFDHTQHSQKSAFIAEESDRFSISTGMEKQFWVDGSTVSINYNYQRDDQQFASPTGIIDQHANGISISYRLPLMKNKNGVLSRLDYELQGFNIDINRLASEEKQEDFLEHQGGLFLDWVLLKEQLQIADNRLTLAQVEMKRIKEKQGVGLADEVDVLRAKDAIINARQNRSLILSQLKSLQAELATLSGLEYIVKGKPDFDLYRIKDMPDVREVLNNLQHHSRLLGAIDAQLQQLSHQQIGFRNQTQAELNLVVSGGLSSENGRFTQSNRFDQPQYAFGLEYRLPFGQRTANADVAKVLLQKQQLQAQYRSVSLQLKSEIRKLLVQINELEKVLELNRQQIDVAEQKTAAELRRYNKGSSELTFVIQSRDSEQQARLSYAQNAANYQKLLLRFASVNDYLFTDTDWIQGAVK